MLEPIVEKTYKKPKPISKEDLRMEAHFSPKTLKSLFVGLWENFDVKIPIAFLAMVLDYLFGADKQYLVVISALIIIDTVMGLMLAAKKSEVSSYGFYRFSTKLLVYFCLAATAKLVDRVLPVAVASPIMFSFLGITEGISIFENAASLGFPVPQRLYKYLKIYNKTLGEDLDAQNKKSDN